MLCQLLHALIKIWTTPAGSAYICWQSKQMAIANGLLGAAQTMIWPVCVWDTAAGEAKHRIIAARPLRYHRGAHQFLTILPDGAFQMSRLMGSA